MAKDGTPYPSSESKPHSIRVVYVDSNIEPTIYVNVIKSYPHRPVWTIRFSDDTLAYIKFDMVLRIEPYVELVSLQVPYDDPEWMEVFGEHVKEKLAQKETNE